MYGTAPASQLLGFATSLPYKVGEICTILREHSLLYCKKLPTLPLRAIIAPRRTPQCATSYHPYSHSEISSLGCVRLEELHFARQQSSSFICFSIVGVFTETKLTISPPRMPWLTRPLQLIDGSHALVLLTTLDAQYFLATLPQQSPRPAPPPIFRLPFLPSDIVQWQQEALTEYCVSARTAIEAMLTRLCRDTVITSAKFGKFWTRAIEPQEGALHSPMSNSHCLPLSVLTPQSFAPYGQTRFQKQHRLCPSLETPHSPCRIGLTPQLSW